MQALLWGNRGPTNFGGRTKGLCVDADNSSNVVAGAASGGLWRSDNAGASWGIKIPPGELHSTSCMIQDTRTGHRNVYYAGTGEFVGTAGIGMNSNYPQYPVAFMGDGIFKSTDGGFGWDRLPFTVSGTPQTCDHFDFIWSVAIDPSNNADDIVYAATAYYGIFKSSNGGDTWTNVLGSGSPQSSRSDVKVTTTGVVYAAGNSGSCMAGIRRSSPGGENWSNITPSNFPEVYDRIVMGTSQSNPNVVYFYIQNVSGAHSDTAVNGIQFWKYTYIADDIGSVHGTWENRSLNLPPAGEPYLLNTQYGYNMLLSVKPDNENFVILGAVELYRSTDGFATGSNWKTIGGFSIDENNVRTGYWDSHCDFHIGCFDPNNYNVFYCGSDGGIFKTTDITANTYPQFPVIWQECNNGYITAQTFFVSIAPEAGSNFMAAGFQDNAVQACTTSGTSSWRVLGGGDGTSCIVAPLATNAVFLTDMGMTNAWRETREHTSRVDISPPQPTIYNSCNFAPIVLDTVSGTLFCNGGESIGHRSGIWRNNNAYTATATSGWNYIPNSGSSAVRRVSTLGISKNTPGVLYYGTDDGNVYKILDATNINNATPTITDISSGKGLPAGYIQCIAVDPDNDQKALVVFANYIIQSLWYTTDGGDTWTDVEGNLAGDAGPSCRWATIFYIGGRMQVFLGTSTGVYVTEVLNGSSTTWVQESPGTIGNVVVPNIDFRQSDGTIAVATHGRGIYTTQITEALPVELASFSGEYSNNKVTLNWKTATEVNCSGYDIEKYDGWQWQKIGFRKAAGNSNSPKTYSFTDDNAKSVSEKTFKYRLKVVDNDGTFKYSNVVEIKNPALKGFELSQNYPNPFNPSTQISFSVASDCKVKLEIFSSTGELVQTLVDETMKAGSYNKNFTANKLPSGVYLYRLSTPVYTSVKKMVIMK